MVVPLRNHIVWAVTAGQKCVIVTLCPEGPALKLDVFKVIHPISGERELPSDILVIAAEKQRSASVQPSLCDTVVPLCFSPCGDRFSQNVQTVKRDLFDQTVVADIAQIFAVVVFAHDVQRRQKQELELLGKGMLTDGVANKNVDPYFGIIFAAELGFDPFGDEKNGIFFSEMIIELSKFRARHGDIRVVIPGDESAVTYSAQKRASVKGIGDILFRTQAVELGQKFQQPALYMLSVHARYPLYAVL